MECSFKIDYIYVRKWLCLAYYLSDSAFGARKGMNSSGVPHKFTGSVNEYGTPGKYVSPM